jgi:hypothetical protein
MEATAISAKASPALPLRPLAPDTRRPTDNPCVQADCDRFH